MKYLVAVDGSEHSGHAVDYLKGLAKADDSIVVYACSKQANFDGASAGPAVESLKAVAANTSLIAEGGTDPREGILACAKKESVQLIVTGSRGQGMIKRALLGSVSTDILHNSDIPVVVVHHPPYEGTNSWVIAVDGSDECKKALNFTKQLLKPEDHVVLYAAFVPPPLMISTGRLVRRNPHYEAALKEETETAEKVLKYAKELLLTDSSFPEGNVVMRGEAAFEPREAVIEFANKNAIRTVVCGTRGMGSVKRAVFGSFSSHLIHCAEKHAVLVVH
eukprot:NODE_990_length_1073_cov_60.719873_g946_i0.p1 GENE.NODE_990_length_1073_cov_60.719873_g946_i0~~NODE_990_length_1073_cov_60.719873_g946_i0.p1  ORF type:complete len:277 (+),score=60.47 NODE_990_length_1073_cov_60.719873_g946_i0:92-922(+)